MTRRRHARRCLDGEGARRFGGRWSSPGWPVVYLSEQLSLATLEVFVHLPGGRMLDDHVAWKVELDDAEVEELAAGDCPPDWRSMPSPGSTAAVGDRWLAGGRSLALRVPSVVVPLEGNLLLNPAHPAAGAVRAEGPFGYPFDGRLARLTPHEG